MGLSDSEIHSDYLDADGEMRRFAFRLNRFSLEYLDEFSLLRTT